ncbi:protein YIPF1 [Aplochiton taeniatus]
MASSDHFQFEEFEDAANLLGANRDATTISIDDAEYNPQQDRGLGEMSPNDEEDDSMANDDKAELLSGQKKNAPFWTFEYYQTFFDVETHQVRDRIIGSVLPWRGKNFVHLYIRKNPDLYGPFWICATLVFAIAISGNISNFLMHLGQPKFKYVPEFRKVTIAATAIYSYAWLVPLALWGLLIWRNNKVMNLVSYSFLEIVCVYGYSLSIYIPAVVLWTLPYEGVRWCSIVVALCLSGSVLVLTFWPAVRDDHPRVSIAIMAAIVALHVLLAVGCKAYFFSRPEDETTTYAATTIALIKPSPST